MATAQKKKSTKRISAKEKEAMQRAKMQMRALFMLAVGALLLGLVFVKGTSLWLVLHNMMFGLMGFTAYILPIGLIYLGILTAMDKPSLALGAKIWQTILLLILICGATQIFGWGVPVEAGLWGKICELYEAGKSLQGGGLFSSIIGIPLLLLFGKIGARITIVILIAFIGMILTGTTLKGLYMIATKPVKSLERAYTKKFMEEGTTGQKQTAEKSTSQSKFNIDIPVDDPINAVKDSSIDEVPITNLKTKKSSKKNEEEAVIEDMPMHPVQSPKDSMDGAQSLLKAKGILLDDANVSSATKIIPEDISSISHDIEKPTEDKDNYIDDIINKVVAKEVEPTVEISNDLPKENEEENQENVDEIDGENNCESENNDEVEPLAENVDIEEELDEEIPEKIYSFPPISLLTESEVKDDDNITEELKANAQRLVNTLQSFGVQTRITEICRGPAVTRYELQPSAGVKISKITGLADDIALNLATAGVRIEAPIPNKAAVGIEVPNKTISMVGIREIVDSNEFVEAKSRLTVAMGKDVAGNITLADLAKMPHLLIAGSTGSGKSVCINSIIISILFKSSPDEVKLLMVDPKVVELGIYNGIPHLLVPVVTDPRKAAGALNWAVNEMLNRYKAFADSGVRDLKGYNKLCQTSENENLKPMPQIVIIIDELADLMMAAPNEVEDAICRLAQMARAAGMHLVIATQRPSVDVITGVIKANIPSRIAFAVSSQVDSRTILDGAGAEKLLGRGDMLFYPVGMPKPIRVQGCFVSDTEVEQVVEFIKKGEKPTEYDQQIIDEIDRQAVAEKGSKSSGKDKDDDGFDVGDDMMPDAIECILEMGQASTSLLQRKLKLGYARAARIMDQLEERGIVGEFEGSKPRQVMITKDQWVEMKMRQSK
ncbi:MAG: DNA translocase FtsK [Oscillospiraceae bacterium]